MSLSCCLHIMMRNTENEHLLTVLSISKKKKYPSATLKQMSVCIVVFPASWWVIDLKKVLAQDDVDFVVNLFLRYVESHTVSNQIQSLLKKSHISNVEF